ncbi:hypothetical protein FE257_007168 [Aspergillus nanangensis]|uniref:Carrier domain-containing protein n=1 Tax=Aspergillus nanangensis TaxID=2582783 RepID=A0AAD4GUH3_ASPNN|nr:hypothetical protein FE257_007168 [Aspergillus nanangensis]
MHPMLRTIFVNSTIPGLLALQVILAQEVCDELSIVEDPTLRQETTQLTKAVWPSIPRLTLQRDNMGRTRMMLLINHAITDATSMGIITRDLTRLYNQGDKMDSSTLPARLPYSYYITHLKQESTCALQFWRARLANVEPCLFPKLNTESGAMDNTSRWQNLPFDLDHDSRRYHEFCAATGITLASLFKLAWGFVLSGFTASRTVCFGYMTSGRDLPLAGIEHTVGPFINALPCPLTIPSGKSILEVLHELQADFTKTLPFQQVSLAAVQHSLGLPGGSPLFNTSLTFPPQTEEEYSNQIRITEKDRFDPTENDIVVEVKIQDKEIKAWFKYWSSTVSEEQAKAIVATLKCVVSQIISSPQKKASEVQLISLEDEAVLHDRNRVLQPYKNACVHTLIDEQCAQHPDAEAIASWDGSLCYRELQELSTKIALRLRRRGIERGTYLPICLSRSYLTPVAILAVMKAGAAFCLLDVSHPLPRLQRICEMLQSPVIITSTAHRSLVENLSQREVFLVDSEITNNTADLSGAMDLDSIGDPSDALFVVFTSGSTGEPKGIIIEHRSYASNALEHAKRLGLCQTSRMLQISGYAFDAAVLEHLTVLLTGGCVCVPSESQRLNNPEDVAARMRVDTIMTTPSMARVLSPTKLPSLRTLALCGEPMGQSDIDKWTPAVRLANVYGPAECTVISTIQSSQQGKHPRNIGSPIAFSAWITMPDDPNQLLPLGAVGELLIEGPIVGRGYINSPEQTAVSFIAPPSWLRTFRGNAPPAGSRLVYRTGDLVYYDQKDGSLRYVGRRDTQIKLRGQRIELSEVEHHLRGLFSGARAVIVEMVRRGQSASLVAFILPEGVKSTGLIGDGTSVFQHPNQAFQRAVTYAIAHLQRDLPSYMVPSAFVSLSQLPLTQTGKVDRRRLARDMGDIPLDMFQELNGRAQSYKTAPSSDQERLLQQIWASTLNLPLDQIGMQDPFFSLGGDSVSAIQSVAQCRSSGLLVQAVDMMRNPAIKELAPLVKNIGVEEQAQRQMAPFALLDSRHERGAVLATVEQVCGIPPAQVEDAYPCTPLQEGLIALTAKSESAYIAEFQFDLPPETDFGRLDSAWKAAAIANPILRTRIVQPLANGRCYQVVIRDPGALDAYPGLETPDLGLNKPLVQAGVVVLENRASLILRIHHSIYDGWSLPLLLEQVQYAYDGQNLLYQSLTPFAEYVQRQNAQASKFWKSELADVTPTAFPPLPSPGYQPTPDSQLTRTVRIGMLVDSAFSLATKLYLVSGLVLSQYTGTREVTFGITRSGREASVPEIEKLTGPTNVTVPQCLSVIAHRTVRESLQHIQDYHARLVPHEQFGLQNIARCGESQAVACSFQTLLVIQPPRRKERQDGLFCLQASPTDLSAFTGYPLLLDCQLFDDAIEIRAGFDSVAISKTQVEQILFQLDHMLGQINKLEAIDMRLQDLQQIHPNDMAKLVSWNTPRNPLSEGKCVHHVILEQCRKQPNAAAVCAWDGTFTYHELDGLSYELSEYLQSCGICPEVVVPIYSEKSRWVTVAILGVIRAGGAFVLLDPSHPLDRLEGICEQTRARLIIASRDCAQSAHNLVASGIVVTLGDHTSPAWGDRGSKARRTSPVPELVTPRSLLYVVFTSGSTGQPKGAMIEHRSCYLSAMGLGRHFGMGGHSRTLQFSSHAFDISVWDHIGTLIMGGCVCIPSESGRKNNLSQVMAELQTNTAILTPSVARTLNPPNVLTVLQTLVLAGEAMTAEDVASWSGLNLINGYGPAECAGITTVQPDMATQADPRNIGYPNDDFSIWITHPDNPHELLPVGAVGEIVVEGPTIGRGYLHDIKKSAESFITSPSWLRRLRGESLPSDARLYKTGDMGQFQPDGSILFHGRRDEQVKIRGQRVELAEIEHHVSRQFNDKPEVIALVMKIGQQQTLVALVARGARGEEDQTAVFQEDPAFIQMVPSIRIGLDRILPPYMIPSTFLPLGRIPLTKSGKTDRRFLYQEVSTLIQKDLQAFEEAEKPYRAPSSRAEQTLQFIFAQTLGVDPETVSADDHFFKRGGDSITAMKLVTEAALENIIFTVADIFADPILSGLARFEQTSLPDIQSVPGSSYYPGGLCGITDLKAFASGLSNLPVPFTPSDVADILPATPFQTSCLQGTHLLYHWLQLPKSVDLDRLEAACHAVVQHHAILRTLFVPHEGQYLQVVLHDAGLSVVHLTCDADLHQFTESLCTRDSVWARTLGPPLFQIYFISHSSTNQRRLVLRLTHAQYDGTSFGLLLQDLSTAYDGKRLPQTTPLFADYLHYKKSRELTKTRQFWQEYLQGASMTRLASVESSEDQWSYSDGPSISVGREIPLPPNQEGIPVSFLCQASWAFILAQLTGERDLVFGLVSQSRNAPFPQMHQVNGPCSNILPTRITVNPDWTVGAFVRHVRDQYIRLMPHASLDLKEIQPLIPGWAPSIRFGSVFNHVNMSLLSAPRLGGVGCEQGVVSPEGAARFLRGYGKFLVRTTRQKDKLGIYLSGWEKGLQAGIIHGLLDQFVRTIDEFSQDYSRPLCI